MLIMAFVFRFFIKEEITHYPHLLFLGLLIWNFFSLSLSKSTPSIVYERALIKKAKFPREVIPLSIILSNFINTVLALGLLLIPILFLGTWQISSIFYLLLALLLLLLFTSGLSLLTSALNVLFRDVNFFVQAFLIVWFYATPIVYPLSFVPDQYRWLWFFNPLTSIVQLAQHACLNTALPNWQTLVSNFLLIIFIIISGVLIFRKQANKFDDWL
jgi:ABC-2 type transport system permease protein